MILVNNLKKENQGRRNLSNYQRSVLALELEEVFSKKAKENQGKRNDINIPQTFGESNKKDNETNNKVSDVAKVSHETIAKV